MTNVYLFGVPDGFDIYPVDDTNSLAYYQQFYDNTIKDDYRFLIRQSKNTVRYTFVKYNLLSHANRSGSLWGMSIVLKNSYFSDPLKILELFTTAYRKLADTNVLFIIGTSVKYKISTFKEINEFLGNVCKVLSESVELNYKEGFEKLDTNLEKSVPAKNALFAISNTSQVINAAFCKYGSVTVSPSIKSGIDEEVENNIELDIEEYFILKEKKAVIDGGLNNLLTQQNHISIEYSDFSNAAKSEKEKYSIDIRSACNDYLQKLNLYHEKLQAIKGNPIISNKHNFIEKFNIEIRSTEDNIAEHLKFIKRIKGRIESYGVDIIKQQDQDSHRYNLRRRILVDKKNIVLVSVILLFIAFLIYFYPSGNTVSPVGGEVIQIPTNPSPENGTSSKPDEKRNEDSLDFNELVIKGDSNFTVLKNFPNAIKRYTQALELKPNDPSVLEKIKKVKDEIKRLKKDPSSRTPRIPPPSRPNKPGDKPKKTTPF